MEIEQRNYTPEAHQTQFEKELEKDYGYEMTEEFRKELGEKFYCVIEDFYETYENHHPEATQTQQVQVKSLGKTGSPSSSSDEKPHPVGTKRTYKESSSSSPETNIQN